MELFQWPVLPGHVFEQGLFCRLWIGVLDRENIGLESGLAIEKHVGARSDQEGTIRSPDRVGYMVRNQTVMNGL